MILRIPRLYAAIIWPRIGELILSDRNHHYLARVLRAKQNQNVELFNGQGKVMTASITAISKAQTIAKIEAVEESLDHRLPVTLGLALIKNDRFDWAIQKATELGVSAIQPFISQFTDSAPKPDRLDKKYSHWREILLNACEQSRNNWLPELHQPVQLDSLETSPQTVIAHPSNLTVAIDPQEPTLLLIGPEGGFSGSEVRELSKKKVKKMGLGPTILRTETAVIVGLTLLGQQYGQY